MTAIQDLIQDKDGVTIHFADGLVSRFHAVWLRDNARGEDARHQDNDQRLFDITELPEDLSLEKASLNEGELEVTYASDGYVSCFPANWLHDNAYDQPRQKDSTITWGRELKSDLPEADYQAILQDPVARADWLRQIRDYGFSLLSNVPCEEGKVCEVAEIFGFVRETNYGRLFEVRSEENPVNLAYTGLGLNVHTDNPYRDPVPGLQLLHCLIANPEGGETILVDGFKVAETLRQEAPDMFRLLSENWVPFRYQGGGVDLQARGPIIQLDDRGTITAVRYNNRSAAPFDLAPELMSDYYKAFRHFAKMLHREEFELGFKLGDGQLMAFDNQRVMHGRKGFGGGKRHLQGTYADKDSLLSMLRVLEKENAA